MFLGKLNKVDIEHSLLTLEIVGKTTLSRHILEILK